MKLLKDVRSFLGGVLPRASRVARVFALCALSAFTCLPAAQASDVSASLPAVSDIGYAFGVDASGQGLKLSGSYVAPLGHRTGFQIDANAGAREGKFTGGLDLHLFARDPSAYLIGLYASRQTLVGYSRYTEDWEALHISRLGIEAEYYAGPLTFSGVFGVQRMSLPATLAFIDLVSGVDTIDSLNGTQPFAIVSVSGYASENLRVTGEVHTDPFERFGTLGLDYLSEVAGLPATWYAQGRFDASGLTSVSAGVEFLFGRAADTPLEARNRQGLLRSYKTQFPELICTSRSMHYVLTECSGCAGGTSGVCQNSGSKFCQPIGSNGKCPRRFSLCREIETVETDFQCFPEN